MKKIKSIEEGVASCFEAGEYGEVPKWTFMPRQAGEMTAHIVTGGKTYPVFDWRCEPQPLAVANRAKNGIGTLCSLKTSGAIDKSFGLERQLYKELDTAEWMLGSQIKYLTAYVNQNAANVIVRMKNDTVAILELGSALPEGAQEQTRHTVWGTHGMASTRVVSQKLKYHSIYLFTDGPVPETFNDTTGYLYGLNEADATATVCIGKMLLGRYDIDGWIEQDRKLREYVKAVYRSSETGERITF